MKKYIAFIVADVVLSEVMWYITCSPTTQENKVTPEEKEETLTILKRAAIVAQKNGPPLFKDADNSCSVSASAAAIILCTVCVSNGASMHDTIDLVMSIYKQTEKLMESHKQ